MDRPLTEAQRLFLETKSTKEERNAYQKEYCKHNRRVWLKVEALDIIDRIADHTGQSKNRVVTEAIKSYARRMLID